MKILHICAGWQKWNGAANIARMLMDEQRREGHEVSFAIWAGVCKLRSADEVWIHCGWLPCLWWAALLGRNVHWMPEACYDPVRLRYHGWKKWLAGPFERFFLRRAKAIVATCEAEKGWIESYLGRRCPPIEVTDIKRFFKLESGKVSRVEHVERVEGDGEVLTQRREGAECAEYERGLPSTDGGLGQCPRDTSASLRLCVKNKEQDDTLHLLYLGRRHPLKGVEYLEKAVAELNSNPVNPVNPVQNSSTRLTSSALSASPRLCVRFVSNAFGEEKERVWDWCDVLVLPTLSDNFGLVIAEALERGKRVITTDGAPAWCDGNDYGGRLTCLTGYRDGTPEQRVEMLTKAIQVIINRGVAGNV